MTPLAALLAVGASRLREGGIDNAMGDARALLAHAAGLAPDRLTLHLNEPADEVVQQRFEDLLARRLRREPVSHLVGGRLFWGRRFAVTPDVLDPRPETEVLVAEALSGPFQRVLDLGTGSGCILLSLLAESPNATGLGVDLSPRALTVAAHNAASLGLAGRVAWAAGSWFAPVSGVFDLIVSNPPYIAADEMAGLAPEVRLHEPAMALTDGADGLSAYRAILSGVGAHLAPGGKLLLEIGPTQASGVYSLARAAGFHALRVLPDLDGRDRVVAAIRP